MSYTAVTSHHADGITSESFDDLKQAIASVNAECKWEGTVYGAVLDAASDQELYRRAGDFQEIPYDFDLLWDIKTLEDLAKKHAQMTQDLATMNNLIKHYHIQLEK